MIYTVKQLATFSGVSTRTLRYYDEIGLLKPQSYTENGYRLYSKSQLLLLQQILFYREQGLSLQDTAVVMNADHFNQINALRSHKNQLRLKVSRLEKMMNTIEKTISHLIDDMPIDEMELYTGLQHPSQKKMKEELVEYMGAAAAEKIIQAQNETSELIDKATLQEVQDEMDTFCKAILLLIESGVSPLSLDAQEWAKWIYQRRMQRFPSSLTMDEAIQFIEMEVSQPKSRKQFDAVHPNFANYYRDMMIEYISNMSDDE